MPVHGLSPGVLEQRACSTSTFPAIIAMLVQMDTRALSHTATSARPHASGALIRAALLIHKGGIVGS